MSFNVAAESYDRFMGRYSVLLSPKFAAFATVHQGQKALDVGCGPGALTAELVSRLGSAAVTGVDPSAPFVEAARTRNPGVTILQASAERLPFEDDTFDVSLAQLVVHFMMEPVAGLAEMRRVTRPDGVVAACVWDLAGGQAPASVLWKAAHQLDPEIGDESRMPGAREGHLAELFAAAELRAITQATLSISFEHPTFDEWWEPYTAGVGPAGAYVAGLVEERRAELRERCRALLGNGPFTLSSRAWAARGVA
jgi:ubiquinone/menaquinone biosynthesis C-methylase UbiE